MTDYFILLALGLVALVVLAPLVLFVRFSRLSRRVASLERDLSALRTGPRIVPTGEPVPPPEPLHVHQPLRPAPAPQPPADPPTRAPVLAHADSAVRVEAFAPATGPAPAELDRMEQLVGGVWLQNLGAVLLLLGVFLMIVWGYSTHRFGPEVLVAAGVVLGLVFAWRGDRVARTMPRFGHALIGIGLGIVYLTLDLGYVRLHVLGPLTALALLALVSFASISAGLRYKVQLIAALGVIGAFLPQFMASWLELGGFHMSPWMLLGYIAVVDVLVFALTARAGWSALDLLALALGALAWISAFHTGNWGWGVQLAFAATYALLGLAPLPRLVRAEGRVRTIDLAVIALAPLAMLGASAPFLAWANREQVAMLLFGLAAVFMGAAALTDSRRPERDLWVPLTGAATVFVTAALERSLAPAVTPVAWCVEGLLLLALGLRPRAGSLRAGGHAVLLLGGIWEFVHLVQPQWQPGMAPLVYAAGLRELGATVAVLLAAGILARGRAQLTALERMMPELWGFLGNLMLVSWCGIEAGHVASAVVDPSANAHRLPPPVGVALYERRDALATSLRVVTWTAHAVTLGWLGARTGRVFLRLCGYAVGGLALFMMCVWPGPCTGWLDRTPLLHLTALLQLAAVAMAFLLAMRLAARRGKLAPFDVHASELASFAASVALAVWSLREATHLARRMLGMVPGAPVAAIPTGLPQLDTLAATFTSGGWLLEAVGLLIAGWLGRSAFLRWSGLALLGMTVLKFIAFDLRTVDVFWRFLTAIAVGAAMLALSYAYQRKLRTNASQA